MGKESRRIRSRRLNGIKKVCCREFFKISTHSARFFRQPPKQDYRRLNTFLDACLKSRRIRSRQPYKKMDTEKTRKRHRKDTETLNPCLFRVHGHGKGTEIEKTWIGTFACRSSKTT